MKRTIVAIALIGVLAASNAAIAQGRHDERPHGPVQQATQDRPMVEPKVHPGGRHDVQSHKNAIKAHNKALAKAKAKSEQSPAKAPEPDIAPAPAAATK